MEKEALKRVSSAETALIYTTEPVWAALFGWAALGERVGPSVAAGGALIIAACLARLVRRPPRPVRPLRAAPAPAERPAAARCRVVRPPGRAAPAPPPQHALPPPAPPASGSESDELAAVAAPGHDSESETALDDSDDRVGLWR
jgi:hypothetical protein